MRFLFVVFLSLTVCKPIKSIKESESSSEALAKIVRSEIGAEAIVQRNSSNTFALGFKSEKSFVKFIVIRLQDNQVVVRDKVQGSIMWSDDMRIKESQIPGIVKLDSKPEDFIKVIDLNQFVIRPK